MPEYRIGKVVAVTGDEVFVALLDEEPDRSGGGTAQYDG